MTTLPDFDAIRQRLALMGGRRTLLGGLAALSLGGTGALLADDDAAAKAKRKGKPARKQNRKQKHAGAQAEKKKAKKLTLCLNGQTVSAPKKKAKKLLKQGATNGACSGSSTTTTSTSSSTAGPCIPDDWDFQIAFGTSGPGPGQLDSPQGIVLSNDTKALWFADADNDRIGIWTRPDATSTVWTSVNKFGENGGGAAEFDTPIDIALSPDEHTAWVADNNNHRVSVWLRNPNNNVWSHDFNLGALGSGNEKFTFPSGVSISPDTLTLWVTDTGNQRVAIWTRISTSAAFVHTASISGSGDTALSQPLGIVTSQDTLTAWVVESGNNRVSIWTRTNTSSSTWTNAGKFGTSGNPLSTPRRIAVAASELTLWVTDQGNNRVTVWTRATTSSHTWLATATFGASGNGNGQFNQPNGVAVSNDGATVLVTDRVNDRLQMWAVDC